MRALNELEKVASILANDLNLQAVPKINWLDETDNAISIRLMPTNNINFYQGQREILFKFQILVKSVSSRKGLEETIKITEHLLSKGYELYNEPTFAYADEKGYVYSVDLEKSI